MRRLFSILAVLVLAMGLTIPFATPVAAYDPTPFTGNVENDFTGTGTWIIDDFPPTYDVGIPVTAPLGTVSGWDMKDFRLTYDPGTDTMYIGINTYGIAGDADGNGNPSTTAQWLTDLMGLDVPNFGGTECFAVYFDLTGDGNYDVIAGIPADPVNDTFGVYSFSGTPFNPGFAFGALIPGHAGAFNGIPTAAMPDIEFSITNWSTLPGNSGVEEDFHFHVDAFLGSQQDAGIGEDFQGDAQGPHLSIVKTVDCNDDDVFHDSETVVGTSDDPVWRIVVTNVGDFPGVNSPVYDIVVTDTNGTFDFSPPFDLLTTGASKTFEYTTHITTTTTNTATAVGVDQIEATVGPVSDSATNTLTSEPHTSVVSITATPASLPAGGADVTIKVVDLNDGDVAITGAYFVLSSSPGGVLGHMSPDGVTILPGATQEFTYTVPNVTVDTLFTAVGHGFAGTFDVSGPSETGSVRVSPPPPVPGFSSLSIGLLIAGLTGALTFFGWQRRKRSQASS